MPSVLAGAFFRAVATRTAVSRSVRTPAAGLFLRQVPWKGGRRGASLSDVMAIATETALRAARRTSPYPDRSGSARAFFRTLPWQKRAQERTT